MDATGANARHPAIDAHESPNTRAAGVSRLVPVLLGALLAAVLFLRKPESLLHPQFWAEDGALFFQGAYNEGFLQTLLQPAAGYLHSLPRLVAGLSLLLPLDRAPLLFNLVAFVVQLAPALYLVSRRMSETIPSLPARVLAALLYVCLPAAYETHVNLTNSHWYLTLTASCILVARPAAGAWVKGLELLVVLLFSLTGPFSILFLPLVAPRLAGLFRGRPADHVARLSLIIAAGAVIQAGFAATSARVGGFVPPPDALSLGELATVVSMHTVFNAVFGINGLSAFYRTLPPLAYVSGLAALAFLLFVAIRDRVRLLLLLFYLAAASIALAFAFPLNDPRLWLHPAAGPRYFLLACVFVHGALLHLALAGRALRPLGVGALAVAVVVGVRTDFFHPRQPDVRWSDNAAVFESLPSGASYYVPVTPLYFPGLTLHKRTPAGDLQALSRLRALDARTPCDASVSRPEKVFLTREANDRFIDVAGWAIDGAAGTAAGGVFIQIDGKLFPAVYGLNVRLDVDGRTYTDCGFSRLIPVAEIGPGAHRLSLVVLSRDGGGRYQPSPPIFFTTGQFFPELAAARATTATATRRN